METKELKVFANKKELIDYYGFINTEASEVIGHKHYILSIEKQLKSFVNGLGVIMYFETVKSKADYNILENYCFLMHSEYVLVLNYAPEESKEQESDCCNSGCGCHDGDDSPNKLIKVDGHDNSIFGIAEAFGEPDRIAYDKDFLLQELVDQGMTQEEAVEYYEFNILGAYIGNKMPIFISRASIKDIEDQFGDEDPFSPYID
jgi:hypothetical protein